MQVVEITTEELSDVISLMTITQTIDTGPMIVHVGRCDDPNLGEVVAVSGATGLGLLIFGRDSENLQRVFAIAEALGAENDSAHALN
jgi:hypothetical protein